jgi:hypothetical protein
MGRVPQVRMSVLLISCGTRWRCRASRLSLMKAAHADVGWRPVAGNPDTWAEKDRGEAP